MQPSTFYKFKLLRPYKMNAFCKTLMFCFVKLPPYLQGKLCILRKPYSSMNIMPPSSLSIEK